MSPRAAWRLERLGYVVFDYTLGKADWLAAGLDTVRTEPTSRRVTSALIWPVPTCGPDTRVADLTEPDDARLPLAVVTNDKGIVLGSIRVVDAAAAPRATAEQVMSPGPATVRADADLDELLGRMARRRVPHVLVTTPEGVLLGAVLGPEADRV